MSTPTTMVNHGSHSLTNPCDTRWLVIKLTEPWEGHRVVCTTFQTQGTLPGCRQHPWRVEQFRNSMITPQAVQSGCCQQEGVVSPLVELAQPSVDVATDADDFQVSPQVFELCLTTQAAGADSGAFWQVSQGLGYLAN